MSTRKDTSEEDIGRPTERDRKRETGIERKTDRPPVLREQVRVPDMIAGRIVRRCM